jgi:PIN domain nuclease of toxin-antitoxin system
MKAQGVVADTHAVIWYFDSPSTLSLAAAAALDKAADDNAQRIFISAITLVEMQYLTEKGKIKASVLPRLLAEIDELEPIIEIVPIDRLLTDELAAIPRAVVPDMPDRIIAATALLLNLPLVSVDAKIRGLSNVVTAW